MTGLSRVPSGAQWEYMLEESIGWMDVCGIKEDTQSCFRRDEFSSFTPIPDVQTCYIRRPFTQTDYDESTNLYISGTEMETRSIKLQGISKHATREELESELTKIGGVIECLETGDMSKGVAFVRFYDLLGAWRVRTSPPVFYGVRLTVQFGPQKAVDNRKKPPNNGTIVIFHMRPGVSDDEVYATFSGFGPIRMIRPSPNRDTQRFVEYWDVRDAEQARQTMNGAEVFESRIAVDYSLPGSYQKSMEDVYRTRVPTIERAQRYY